MNAADPPAVRLNWRRVLPWALYDWANSGYAVVVLAGFFPIFFKDYWNPPNTPGTVSDFRLTIALSVSSLIVAFLAPTLGAIADGGGRRKRFLCFFAAMGIIATGCLYLIKQGEWQVAMIVYMCSMIGFSGANIFYDSLLVNVTDESKFDVASAVGYAMGYIGGGLLLLLNVFMTTNPQSFGLASTSDAVRTGFLLVGVWWMLFSIPLFWLVPEAKVTAASRSWRVAVREGFAQLRETFRQIRRLRVVFLFLCAYWLYIDGVDTIITVAVAYGKTRGFGTTDLIKALLMTQFIAFPSAIAFGKLGEKIGAKNGIFIGLAGYLFVTVWGYFMTNVQEFFVLAAVIGLVQGGVQSLSRSLYARLIPREKAAQFFGFYNMLGKFAAIIGPALYGFVGLLTGSSRLAILAIVLLFIAGGSVLYFVREEPVQSQ